MGQYIDKLISISSDSLNQGQVVLALDILELADRLSQELVQVLSAKNGFFVFESALRVFPSESSDLSIGLVEWNSNDLWRNSYDGLADDCLFFAEDIFGGQFCIKENYIFYFDPETGSLDAIANTLEDWAKEILNDYNVLTGYSLAHEWQMKNGLLSNNMRLMPKIPFVCGSEFKLSNLMAIDAVSGMRFRGNLACNIRDLPEGDQIKFQIVD